MATSNKQYPDTADGVRSYLRAETPYDLAQIKKITKSNISAGIYAVDLLSGTRVVVYLMGYGFQVNASNNEIMVAW